MIAFNTEYDRVEKELKKIRKEYLQTEIPFGKYRGKTIDYVYSHDSQYLIWLIRESEFKIDVNILGFDIPTLNDVIRIFEKYNSTSNKTICCKFIDGNFKITEKIYHPAVYDDWNSGHYGASNRPIREAYTSVFEHIYLPSEILKIIFAELCKFWPYIKWDENYILKLIKEHKELKS